MATTRIVNPRVYTKDSFYYQFVWEWEVVNDQGETIIGANPDIDLNKEYEVMLYNGYNIPYNENKSFIVKYNTPISFLDIYNLYKEDGLLQRGANVKFKIREKQENDLSDWSDLFPSESSFLLASSVINCSAMINNEKNQMSVAVGPEFRNYYNNNIDNYNLTMLKETADKISVHVSHKNEELVYEPQTNHTAHLEWDANYYGDQWIRFDFESITKIANFSGLHLISNVTPVSCDLQISDGSTIDDIRTQSVVVQSDSDRIYPNDFTEITINNFGENDWSAALFVTGYVNNEVVEENQVEVGNTIDISSYDYFTFRVQYYTVGTTTSVDYTVNEQQWETIKGYGFISEYIEVIAENIECSSIRLRGDFIGAIDDNLSITTSCIIPNQDSYKQNNSLSLNFDFGLNYNSDLSLETEYNMYVSENKISSWGRDDKTTIIIPQEEHSINDTDFISQIEIPTPSYQGGLIYIKKGYGWKINGVSVSPGETIDCLHGSLNKEKIIIDKNEELGVFSPLSIIIYGTPNEQVIKFNNKINFATGTKYAQQYESFDDLNSLDVVSIRQFSFDYSYQRHNNHTPVFIYQKIITLQGEEYKLTNDISSLNNQYVMGTISFNSSSATNTLKITTSPVVVFSQEQNKYILKTEHITQEEIDSFLDDNFANKLNVAKVFNSKKENFLWNALELKNYNGLPGLNIQGSKTNYSNLYHYKVKIVNQISCQNFLNKTIDLVNYDENTSLWCLKEDDIYYTPDKAPLLLKNLKEKELSSKEQYHIQIIRQYNNYEVILLETDLIYNKSDFFTAPINNVNYKPGEEVDFYFSTERNNSTNEWQGYPWIIYNNKDSASYFCYSNQACSNNGNNSNIKNYDKNISDNTQLVCINYHDKPNFTQKTVIPIFDFKITELVEDNIQTYGTFENSTTNVYNLTIDDNLNLIKTEINESGSFELIPKNSYSGVIENTEGVVSVPGLTWTPLSSSDSSLEILDTINNKQLYYYAENNANSAIYFDMKELTPEANLKFNLQNGSLGLLNSYIVIKTLTPASASVSNRKFYIDNFSVNEIDYSQIENGSIISGQVLELHKPVTLHIEDFTTNMSSNNSIYYKIEKINEYNQDAITPIDDDNSITILQKDRNGNEFTKDFYINSHTNQLKIQNTKTKQITFNNAQKDTIVNCILEKEEVED